MIASERHRHRYEFNDEYVKNFEENNLIISARSISENLVEIIELPKKEISETGIREILKKFVGQLDQIPPMFSAKKIGGKKMYELARRGIEVVRQVHTEHKQGFRVVVFVQNLRQFLGLCFGESTNNHGDDGKLRFLGKSLEGVEERQFNLYHLHRMSQRFMHKKGIFFEFINHAIQGNFGAGNCVVRNLG